MKNTTRIIAATALLIAASANVHAQNEDVPKALPVAKAEPTKARPIANAVRPLSVTVELVDSETSIRGTLTETTTLDMKTSFGVVQVPLTEVAGFRFPSVDDATTTVVMLNGDSITGASDVKRLTVETEWGVAEINGQSIQSILFVPSLTWASSKGLSGKRWGLSEQQPVPTPRMAPRSSQTSRTSPSSSTQQSSSQSSRPIQSSSRPTFQGQPQFSQGFGN